MNRMLGRCSVLANHISPSPLYCSKQNYSSQKAILSISPDECLQDEEINIRAEGLPPHQPVTISAHHKDERNTPYFSYSHYVSDNNGAVDVRTMASVGGSYAGVIPMGLISTLVNEPTEKSSRIIKSSVATPIQIHFNLLNNHLPVEDVLKKETPVLSSAVNTRYHRGPGVRRIELDDDVLRGVLFLPPGDGPFPGVVDIFGSGGNLYEYRGAQLASRGFGVLCLAYFSYKDLPKTFEHLHISYFERAVQYLLKQKEIKKSKVGVLGSSKGGDVALIMGTFIPEVSAVVNINGGISSMASTFTLHDRVIPPLLYDLHKTRITDEGAITVDTIHDPLLYPETIIPVEQSDAAFLFCVGEADQCWNSGKFAEIAEKRFKSANKTNYQILRYKDTNHLIDPPFAPFCGKSFHPFARIMLSWGGNFKAHSDAQVHWWTTVRKFLYDNIMK